MKAEFSFRYGVAGVYKDRGLPVWRIYPLPFVRISLGRGLGHTVDCEPEKGPDYCVGHE